MKVQPIIFTNKGCCHGEVVSIKEETQEYLRNRKMSSVSEVYRLVVDDVIKKIAPEFENDNLPDSLLSELQRASCELTRRCNTQTS